MSRHIATVQWQRGEQPFLDNRYSRAHVWHFDGGVTIKASSSPSVIPVPLSATDAVDPEEAMVAALSSCHMLFFLMLAARAGFVVDTYADHADGTMAASGGLHRMTEVVLRPKVEFAGEKRPDAKALAELHHAAHSQCYLAASVNFDVRCEIVES
jgi:organic hydroperoxide reductase OsmC/OhrA